MGLHFKAIVFVLIAALMSVILPQGPVFAILGFSAAAIFTPKLCMTDIRELRLPNAITVPLFFISAVSVLIDSFVSSNSKYELLIAFCAALLILLVFFIISIFGGLGMGDVKLSASLLILVSSFGILWPMIFVFTAFLSAFIGLLAAFSRFFLYGKTLEKVSRMPFGPFLLAGFWITVGFWSVNLLL